jgi:putative endonuclease
MRWNKIQYCVYITTNYNKTVLYTGVTNNLESRITEHYLDQNDIKKFAGKYKAFYVLYYELHQYIDNAIAREKEIKGWRREKKMELIKTINPRLDFLNYELFDTWPPINPVHRKDIEL